MKGTLKTKIVSQVLQLFNISILIALKLSLNFNFNILFLQKLLIWKLRNTKLYF